MANPALSISLTALAALLLPLAMLLSFTSLQAAQVFNRAGAMAGAGGGGGGAKARRSPAGYVPVRAVVYRSVSLPLPAATTTDSADEAAGGGGGGEYEPFELCMGCRCCATTAAAAGSSSNGSSSCVDTRCCYAIDCNIPGKPFGVCAFSPRTCGCGGAGNNNCTTS